MSFLYPYILTLLFLLPLFWVLARKRESGLRDFFAPELYKKMVSNRGGLSAAARRALMLAAVGLGIIALARPYIDRGEMKIKSDSAELVAAFDISRSMTANDVYPNRFEMAKRKFHDLLSALKDTRVAVIGFSSRAFLIAPLSDDYESLKYLVDHMSLEYVSLKGTNLMAALEAANSLLEKRGQKALLVFTDGGDKRDFSKEIDYAKKHGIKVFIYAIGTKKGGVMKLENGDIVRDAKGNIVITRLNGAIADLAKESGGVYRVYSLHSGDMKRVAADILKRLKNSRSEERVVKMREELFYYPLAASIVLFMISLFSLPREVFAMAGSTKRGMK